MPSLIVGFLNCWGLTVNKYPELGQSKQTKQSFRILVNCDGIPAQYKVRRNLLSRWEKETLHRQCVKIKPQTDPVNWLVKDFEHILDCLCGTCLRSPLELGWSVQRVFKNDCGASMLDGQEHDLQPTWNKLLQEPSILGGHKMQLSCCAKGSFKILFPIGGCGHAVEIPHTWHVCILGDRSNKDKTCLQINSCRQMRLYKQLNRWPHTYALVDNSCLYCCKSLKIRIYQWTL